MSDWPIIYPDAGARPVLNTLEEQARVCGTQADFTSQVPFDAAAAYAIPVWLPRPKLIKRLAVLNGAAVAGNVDVGIYLPEAMDRYGSQRPSKLLVSSGATAQAGTSQWQVLNISDVSLPMGLYFLAVKYTNIAATFLRSYGYAFNTTSGAGVLPTPGAWQGYTPLYVPILAMSGVA